MKLKKEHLKDYVLTGGFSFVKNWELLFCIVLTDSFWKQEKIYFNVDEWINYWIIPVSESDVDLINAFKEFLKSNNFKKVVLKTIKEIEF